MRYRTLLGMGGDGRVGTGNIGVSAAGDNELGGIVPQSLSMDVDVEVEYISKKIPLQYQYLHGGLILVGEVPW